MFPTLLSLGPIAISSLGFFLFLAFVAGSFFIWQKGREENFDAETLMDGVILSSVFAVVFGRVFYVLFTGYVNIQSAINFFKYPGFSYYGALFGGIVFMVYFSQRQNWDFFRLSDVFVFGIIPSQILVRIGDFLDGSYLGKPTDFFLGIQFPGMEGKVHPISLYEIIFLSVLLFIIRKLERQYRLFAWYRGKRGEAEPGFLFLTYLICYNIFRFLLEFIRDSGLYWKGFSIEQVLAVGITGVSLIIIFLRSGQKTWMQELSLKKLITGISSLIKKEELEILVPVPKQRLSKGSNFIHIKAGMEAKELIKEKK